MNNYRAFEFQGEKYVEKDYQMYQHPTTDASGPPHPLAAQTEIDPGPQKSPSSLGKLLAELKRITKDLEELSESEERRD